VLRDSHKKNPNFLSDLHSFRVLWHFNGYPMELHSAFTKMGNWCYCTSVYGLVYINIFHAASINQYHSAWCTQPIIRIILSMFSFSLFLARGKGNRSIEKPHLLCLLFSFFFQVGCTAMFYSTQGSVQAQEIGVV